MEKTQGGSKVIKHFHTILLNYEIHCVRHH